MSTDLRMSNFIQLLHAKGFIKRGNYTLKSGLKTDLYINLRTMISDYELLESFVPLMRTLISQKKDDFALIGVPDGAIPITVYLATILNMKVLILPKKVKAYGDPIELKYYQGHKIILIEDVVSTGSSVLETVKRLESYGAEVVEIISIVDRELGAKENIEKSFPLIEYQSLVSIKDIVAKD